MDADETEKFRHECEVRHVANIKDKASRKEYLADVARFRGRDAAQAIITDLRKIARAGSAVEEPHNLKE